MKMNQFFGTLKYLIEKSKENNPNSETETELETPHQTKISLDHVVHATTVENKHYYRIPLAENEKNIFDSYSLIEGHISIFKDLDCKHNSEYHFTGIFKKSDNFYRLRVFFNHNDDICATQWFISNDNASFQYCNEKPRQIEQFIRFAQDYTLPVISGIRSKRSDVYQILVNTYNELQEECSKLSVDLISNKTQCINKIEEIRKILKQLEYISSDSRWFRIKNLFINWQSNIENTSSDDDKEEHKNDKDPVNDKDPKNDEYTDYSSLTNKAHAGKSKDNWMKLKDLNAQLNKTGLQITKEIQLINDIDAALKVIDFNASNQLTLEKLNLLNEIESENCKKALTILNRSLLTNNFSQAKKLSAFYHLLNPNLIKIALVKRNPNLLDFLITEVKLPVNTISIELNHKNKKYPNALAYCFKEFRELQNKTEHKVDLKLLDCFSVLVNSGSSLIKPAGANELPMAHVIFSDLRSPLYTRLLKKHAKVLHNPQFFSDLIAAMQLYINKNKTHLSKNELNELTNSIERYDSDKKTTQNNKDLNRTEKLKTLTAKHADLQKKLPSDFINSVKNDKELNDYLTALNCNEASLFNRKRWS